MFCPNPRVILFSPPLGGTIQTKSYKELSSCNRGTQEQADSQGMVLVNVLSLCSRASFLTGVKHLQIHSPLQFYASVDSNCISSNDNLGD